MLQRSIALAARGANPQLSAHRVGGNSQHHAMALGQLADIYGIL